MARYHAIATLLALCAVVAFADAATSGLKQTLTAKARAQNPAVLDSILVKTDSILAKTTASLQASLESKAVGCGDRTDGVCGAAGGFKLACAMTQNDGFKPTPSADWTGTLNTDLCKFECHGAWTGDKCSNCGQVCINGKVNKATCTCECDDWWSGTDCTDCSLDCGDAGGLVSQHCKCDCHTPWKPSHADGSCTVCDHAATSHCENGGKLGSDCKCQCKGGWGVKSGSGHLNICSDCTRDCKNGGHINASTCECHCVGPWGKENCDYCPLTSAQCGEHGTVNESKCICDCDNMWGGDHCDRFHQEKCLGCGNSGDYKEETSCACVCAPITGDSTKLIWAGEQCENCPRVTDPALACTHGQLQTGSCLCTECGNWEGAKCDECNLKCTHGTVNKQTCECDCGATLWEGILCNECHAECAHGGQMEMGTCTCKCPGQWKGNLCDHCPADLKAKCEAGGNGSGVWDERTCKCNCLSIWDGALCETCKRVDAACWNGAKVDKVTCKCTVDCKAPWNNDNDKSLCNNCAMPDPENGCVPDEANCKCSECLNSWNGDHCKHCPLTAGSCKTGGKLEADKCKCDCSTATKKFGVTCDVCHLKGKCVNGSLDTRKCECACSGNWSGVHCDECTKLECKNGSVFDPESCSCTGCDTTIFDGATCAICKNEPGKCVHPTDKTTIDPNTCVCTNCEGNWAGNWCDTCDLTADDLAHAKSVDPDTCTGFCDPKWKGQFCNECKQESCGDHGKLDRNTCDCVCNHAWWSGTSCDQCLQSKLPCVNGTPTESCLCVCEDGWAGMSCSECALKQKDCKNGSKLNESQCHCMCEAPWRGRMCAQCNLSLAACKASGHANMYDEGNCVCYDSNRSFHDIFLCEFGWGATDCKTCVLTEGMCNNSGSVDKVACKCNCNPGFGGETCTCERKCVHGGTLQGDCTCIGCQGHWGGVECNTCNLDPEKCFHGSIVDDKTCTCAPSCPAPWSGTMCEQCPGAAEGNPCSGAGSCDESHKCRCNEMRGGCAHGICPESEYDCSQTLREGYSFIEGPAFSTFDMEHAQEGEAGVFLLPLEDFEAQFLKIEGGKELEIRIVQMHHEWIDIGDTFIHSGGLVGSTSHMIFMWNGGKITVSAMIFDVATNTLTPMTITEGCDTPLHLEENVWQLVGSGDAPMLILKSNGAYYLADPVSYSTIMFYGEHSFNVFPTTDHSYKAIGVLGAHVLANTVPGEVTGFLGNNDGVIENSFQFGHFPEPRDSYFRSLTFPADSANSAIGKCGKDQLRWDKYKVDVLKMSGKITSHEDKCRQTKKDKPAVLQTCCGKLKDKYVKFNYQEATSARAVSTRMPLKLVPNKLSDWSPRSLLESCVTEFCEIPGRENAGAEGLDNGEGAWCDWRMEHFMEVAKEEIYQVAKAHNEAVVAEKKRTYRGRRRR